MKKMLLSLLCAAVCGLLNAATITINHAGVVAFSVAAVGQTQSQTFDVSTSGISDWSGKVIISSQSTPGTFIFGAGGTGLLNNGTVTKTLVFQPQSTGTFTATITASATGATPVSFTVTGTCGEGPAPEQKEGDEWALDASNPLSVYETSFDGVARNGVLSLDGWTNAATVGTRAWWGYEFEGDNCAKVTCFDSQQGKGTSCQMMLASPALDFINAPYRQLGFRLRGDFLSAEMPDSLTVVYMDMAGGSLYVQPLMVAARTSDESGEWFPYVVHLEEQELADVFWIGFLFNGTRGAGHAATYYVDDFSWGKWLEDVPTALPAVHRAPRAIKYIENGQLIILRDNLRYSVTGQLLK